MTNFIEQIRGTTFQHDIDWTGRGLLRGAVSGSVALQVAGHTSIVIVEVVQHTLMEYLTPAIFVIGLDDDGPRWEISTGAVLART